MARLTGQQADFMRTWLTRSIAALGTLPPTPERDRTIAALTVRLEEYPASNVVQLRVKA